MLPKAKFKQPKSKSFTIGFKGYNNNSVIEEGELRSMKNLSSDNSPCISPRASREYIRTLSKPHAIYSKNNVLCYVDGTNFYYNNQIKGQVTEGKKSFVSFNDYILIFPDKKYFNTYSGIFGDMERKYSNIPVIIDEINQTIRANIIFEGFMPGDIVTISGSNIPENNKSAKIKAIWKPGKEYLSGTNEIELINDGQQCYIKTKGRGFTNFFPNDDVFIQGAVQNILPVRIRKMKRPGYKFVTERPIISATTDSKIISGTPFEYFSVGDIVKISGSNIPFNNKTAEIIGISGDKKTLTFPKYTFVSDTGPQMVCIEREEEESDKYMVFDKNVFQSEVVAGKVRIYVEAEETSKVLTFEPGTFKLDLNSTITIKRAVPDIDFACEHENRIWGIKGSNIYASKLGDAMNWNCFEGLSTDSYATSVGSEGDFTGIIKHQNHVLFFKENFIHELYGNSPSNFTLQGISNLGCQKGCSKSIVSINNVVYYKSIKGIMEYSGAIPRLISDKLNESLDDAVAGTDDRKYYVSMSNEDDYRLYVYDTLLGTWHIEDYFRAKQFTKLHAFLYVLDDDGKIIRFNSGNETVEWECETDKFYESISNKKGYSKIYVRAELETGSSLSVLVKTDNNPYRTVNVFTTPNFRVFECIIKPERCDHFQIKFIGSGKAKIYSLEREFFYGSVV